MAQDEKVSKYCSHSDVDDGDYEADIEVMATNEERDIQGLQELVNLSNCDQSASDRSNYDKNQGTNSADVNISNTSTDKCGLHVAPVIEHDAKNNLKYLLETQCISNAPMSSAEAIFALGLGKREDVSITFERKINYIRERWFTNKNLSEKALVMIHLLLSGIL